MIAEALRASLEEADCRIVRNDHYAALLAFVQAYDEHRALLETRYVQMSELEAAIAKKDEARAALREVKP